MNSIKRRLKRIRLMAKKDTTVTIDTKGQTEAECGVRMLTYMILFRSMNVSQLRDGQIIQRIKGD